MSDPHVMTLQEVRDVLNFPCQNPTVSAMIFVETRKTAVNERKLFPCYPIRYDEKSNKLLIAVAQCSGGARYFFGYVDLPREDIGVKCRFWSGAPSVEAMDADPLSEAPAEEPEEKDNVEIEEVPPQ